MVFLDQIRDSFFVQTRTGNLLNKDVLIDAQRKDFPAPLSDAKYETMKKDSDYNKLLKDQLSAYHKKTLANLYQEPQGFALAIDGQYLHQGEYCQEYLDYLYFKIIESKYAKQNSGTCHLCGSEGIVGEDTSLRQKFYGTTNLLYFDNVTNTRTYTNFGMCQECDLNLVVGMTHAMTELRFRILDLSCIIIPNTNRQTGLIEPIQLRSVERVLNRPKDRRDKIRDDIETILTMSRKCPGFILMIYNQEKGSQEFRIINLIRDINFANLAQKTEDLEHLSDSSNLYILSDNMGLTLKGMRMLILPPLKMKQEDIKKHKYIPISRQIAQLVDRYLNSRPFYYTDIIRNFVDVWSHIEYGNEDTYLDHELAAFSLGLYLKHLNNFNMLKGVKAMEQEQILSTQLDPEHHGKYLEYFENHAYLFTKADNSIFYRGLFLLGTMIGKIENAEYSKNGKKTFSNRLNFKGISPRRVKALYNTVEEYLKIRGIWIDNQALSHCNESLMGVENSTLLPQEIVYYLLSGRAFENYLGIIFNKTQKQEKQTMEE